jgi:hypothetical protein
MVSLSLSFKHRDICNRRRRSVIADSRLGIGFGVASGSANSDNLARGATAGGVCSTSPTSQVCLDGKSTRDSQQTDAIVSTIAYVAGGVALATAVVWWLVAPRKVVEHQAMIVPTFGPHGAGAAFNFTF